MPHKKPYGTQQRIKKQEKIVGKTPYKARAPRINRRQQSRQSNPNSKPRNKPKSNPSQPPLPSKSKKRLVKRKKNVKKAAPRDPSPKPVPMPQDSDDDNEEEDENADPKLNEEEQWKGKLAKMGVINTIPEESVERDDDERLNRLTRHPASDEDEVSEKSESSSSEEDDEDGDVMMKQPKKHKMIPLKRHLSINSNSDSEESPEPKGIFDDDYDGSPSPSPKPKSKMAMDDDYVPSPTLISLSDTGSVSDSMGSIDEEMHDLTAKPSDTSKAVPEGVEDDNQSIDSQSGHPKASTEELLQLNKTSPEWMKADGFVEPDNTGPWGADSLPYSEVNYTLPHCVFVRHGVHNTRLHYIDV